jgi:WD40 repeat protein
MSGTEGGSKSANARTKTTYRPFAKLEKFYTGGSVHLTVDESALVCVCADEVKVRPGNNLRVSLSAAPQTRGRPASSGCILASDSSLNAICKQVGSYTTLADSRWFPLEPGLRRSSMHPATQVVDLASGATTQTLPGDTEPVTAIAVSPNGKHIFSASRSLTSKAWDLATGTCFRTWRVRSHTASEMPCHSWR